MATQDRSLRHSVCLNHPDRPATARCTVCFKPVCEECLIRDGAAGFCSQVCADNYGRTKGTVDAWHGQRQRDVARRRRRTLVRLIVLLIIAIAAYLYFTRNPGKLDRLKDSAGKTVQGVKRGIGK
jgi:hypothetical protein